MEIFRTASKVYRANDLFRTRSICRAFGLLMVLQASLSSSAADRSGAERFGKRVVGLDTTFGDRYHEAAKALQSGQYEEAIAKASAALALKPDGKNASILYFWRGVAREETGDYQRAIADYGDAIRSDPAGRFAHGRRGPLNTRTGNYESAIADLTRTLRDEPGAAGTYVARGGAYLKSGKLEAAKKDFETFLRTPGRDAWDHAARAKVYFALGQYEPAAAEVAIAKRMSSSDSYVLNEAAWFEATCPRDSFRNAKAAVRDATRACELTHWKDPGAIDTLAVAYAEGGDFERAVSFANQAFQREGAFPAERREVEEHLRSFQARKPYREESKFK